MKSVHVLPRAVLTAAVVFCLAILGPLTPAASAAGPVAVAPIDGPVTRSFDPPALNWGTGHRGVDLAVTPGELVVAAMAGTVTFAGTVVDRGVVTILHDTRATTYEPVTPLVAKGDIVYAGTPIGVLAPGHSPCPADACLHWGLKEGSTYLNPLSLLRAGPVRLLPGDGLVKVQQRKTEWEDLVAQAAATGVVSAAGLVRPAFGSFSSGFGMRIHPITQVWTFHNGLDIAATCGTPILAAAAGVVTEEYYSDAYGNRLIIDHGTIDGHQLVTSYNHAEGYVVAVGDTVQQGQVIGSIGTTGSSTGCHLHFQTWVDGELADPAKLLP